MAVSVQMNGRGAGGIFSESLEAGLGFKVSGLGFKLSGLWFKGQGSGFRV